LTLKAVSFNGADVPIEYESADYIEDEESHGYQDEIIFRVDPTTALPAEL